MGDIAEQLIDEEMFGESAEYKPRGNKKHKGLYRKTAYIHLTPSQRKIASIRKEIAIAVNEGIGIQEARKQANLKYGKGWRERGLTVSYSNQWTEEDLKQFKQ